MLRLLKVKYPHVHATVNIPNDTSLDVENGLSAKALYHQDGQHFTISMQVASVCKQHPEQFDLGVTVVGAFFCDTPLSTDEEKQRAHTVAIDMLFPLVQALFADMTAKADVPPYFFDKLPINPTEIVIEKKAAT